MGVVFIVFGVVDSSGHNTRSVGPPEIGWQGGGTIKDSNIVNMGVVFIIFGVVDSIVIIPGSEVHRKWAWQGCGTIKVINIANMGVIFIVFGVVDSNGHNTKFVGPPKMGVARGRNYKS